MSLLVPCPNCGPRDVGEFAYSGETTERPQASPSPRELASYIHFRRNTAGVQREWWYHRFGCELWFLAERDTRTNEVLKTELPSPAAAGTTTPREPETPDTPAV